MSAVSLQNIVAAGIVPSYAAVGASDVISGVVATDRTFLHVKNGGGSSTTVAIAPVSPTVVRAAGVGNVTVPSISVAVAGGAEKLIGPIPAAYIDQSGQVTVTYSVTTSVTAAAFALPSVSL